MFFSTKLIRAGTPGWALGLGAFVGLALTALYYACRQEHLYRDGGFILKYLATGEDTPYYTVYVAILRAVVRATAPLGLSLQDASCLVSAFMGGGAIGITVVALRWAGASVRGALIVAAIAATAPAQVFHSTTVDKRTLTELGAAIVLIAAVRARMKTGRARSLLLAMVAAAAVHLHYNVVVAALPAIAWFALGPGTKSARRIGAALLVTAACALSLLAPALLASGPAESASFMDHWGSKLLAVPSSKHLGYLPVLVLDLAAGLGLVLLFAIPSLRRPRARWVLIACIPMLALHLYGMELYEPQLTVLPDSPGARGAYLIAILPVLSLLCLPLVRGLRGKAMAAVLAAAVALHGSVFYLWYRDRGESWPDVVRNVRAVLVQFPGEGTPPIVLFRSFDYVFVARAMIPEGIRYAPLTADEIVDFESAPADRIARAEAFNRSAHHLVASGGAILVCPGFFETIRERGGGDAAERILRGLTLVPAPGAAAGTYGLLRPATEGRAASRKN